MTVYDVLIAPLDRARHPTVQKIGFADLGDALVEGFVDFTEKPTHVMFLCLIYPIVGILFARMAMGSALMPLFLPLVAGFAIVGPLAAIGLYEVSRRREQGLDASWARVFDIVRSPSIASIGAGGLVLLTLFVAWLAAANAIYTATLGPAAPASLGLFVKDVLTTPAGWTLVLAGNAAGILFSGLALTIGIVTFPLLLDRDVSLSTANSNVGSVRC